LAIVAFLCLPIAADFTHEPAQQPMKSLPLIHEVLRDWKHTKRITIEFKDATLKQVMDELRRQSGVRFDSFHEKEKLTLKLKDVPLWQAVAETSIRADLPIWVFYNEGDEIRFASTAEYVFKRFQIAGPFHIGVQTDRLVFDNKTKEMTAIVIRASCLSREGFALDAVKEATLEFAGEKSITLEPASAAGKPGNTYFIVPEEMLKKKAKLRAKIDCEVYLDHQEVIVPVKAGYVADFKHFGGIKVKIEKVEADSVTYRVSWDSKLRGEGAKWLARVIEMREGNGMPLTDEEIREYENGGKRNWIKCACWSVLRVCCWTKKGSGSNLQKARPWLQNSSVEGCRTKRETSRRR
jgi:hypothetical protein